MRVATAAVLVAAILAACGVGLAPQPAALDPVEIGLLGQVIPQPGDRPPIECRGLARERCEGPGGIIEGVDEIERVIVSCIGVCSSAHGEFRIDIVIGGRTELSGQGEWGSAP